MNVPLLREIQQRILAEPDAFRMDTWSCGTAHCIAGWALALRGLKVANPDADAWEQRLTDGRWPQRVAAELLDVRLAEDDWTQEEADRLFVSDMWPLDFEERYETAETRAEKARIAAERIDHFIATNGEE